MGDMTTYEMHVEGRCPNDDAIDDYLLVIECRDGFWLQADSILEAVRVLTSRPVYQETLTGRLRRRLAGRTDPVTVTTIGLHLGVKTTCVCS